MKVPLIVCMGFLSIGVLATPIAGKAEPTIEQFRFDPPQLCLRDMFRWGFSYRGFPGGLAAVKEVELRGLSEGRPVRSPLTPTTNYLQRYTADQGRFKSCGSGFWGGQRPSLAHYVTGMGPMDGATAAGGRSCCLPSR